MSAYLKFFELEQSPFEGKAQAKVVLGTRALRDAFGAIRDGLEEGSARICVNGGPGLGKTSLARSLPKLLGDVARVAVVLDPSVSWESLRGTIAKQWGLESGGLARTNLLEAARERRLVLVIDRAEQASEEFLDHLDIMLSVRSELDEPAVQSVLLACLVGAENQEPAPLIWWLDRIQTLQLEFAPIPRDGVESYIRKHLKRAGWRGEQLFCREAALAIHGVTGGIPGEISTLCERLLAAAAEADLHGIDEAFVLATIDETGEDDEREEESTVEEAFEEIVLDDECEEASPEASEEEEEDEADDEAESEPTLASLAKTLEHFEEDEEEPESVEEEPPEIVELSLEVVAESDESDESEPLVELEEFLAAPASSEELHAIRRDGFSSPLRAAAAVFVAVLVGAIAFAWLTGDDDPDRRQRSTSTQSADSSKAADGHPESDAQPDKVLARLRGPVTVSDSAASPLLAAASTEPEAAQTLFPEPAGGDSATERSIEDLIDEDFEEMLDVDDFVDMRPAAMRPDASANPDGQGQLW